MSPSHEQQSRVLTLVFTDLADSTALKNRLGDIAVDALITRHRDVVTQLAEECSGRVIDWAGDGCFLTFETSSAGVLFALRLEQAHAESPDLPGVRVGIHLGEVTEKPGVEGGRPRVDGLAVDLASRICGLAKPGQVLMSSAVYNSARQRLGVETLGQPVLWQTHGTYALKGFDEPLDIGEAALEGVAPLEAPVSGDKAKLIRRAKHSAQRSKAMHAAAKPRAHLLVPVVAVVLVLGLAAVAYLAGKRGTREDEASVGNASAAAAGRITLLEEAEADAPITSLAVLPFTNMSGDPQQEYFVDSMTEALIAELAKIKSIKVISRTSAMHYKSSDKAIPEIARELGVDGLVEGSALKSGNEVRITAQLIRGATDEHLWAENYTETLENVLKVQAQVALAITSEIKAVVTPDERDRVNAARTVNAAAYELYAQARYFLSLRNAEDFARARELFERSLDVDPDFALGHAGLADLYFVQADYNLVPSAEGYALARKEAEKALALDPDLGEAYTVLAMLAMSQNWDWNEAERLRLKSLELSPNYATARHWSALFLSAARRREEAVAEIELAYQLDPVSPVIAASLAQFLSGADRIQESVELAERTADQHPNNWRVLLGLSSVYLRAGRYEDALAAAERMAAAEGNKSTADMYRAIAIIRLGRIDEARKLIEVTAANPDAADGVFVHIARAYTVLGEHDRAIEWLTKAVDTRDRFAWRMDVFSEFDAIRDDSRYKDLLRRMNFPE